MDQLVVAMCTEPFGHCDSTHIAGPHGSHLPNEPSKRIHPSVILPPRRSWNRTPSLGYRVVNLQLADDGRTITDHTVFADG